MTTIDTATNLPAEAKGTGVLSLMTHERWIEVGRIVLTGVVAFLYWQQLIPLYALWAAVAIGLYPLVKTGLTDLFTERKVGTEIFVTIATLVAVFGGETVAGAVLMVIILIAEFIAELNTDRARASIKALIGSVPQTALLRENGKERIVPIAEVAAGQVVLVRTGEKIPVDGVVVGGSAAVNQAPITGESIPQDKIEGAQAFAGTIVEAGAIDVRTDNVGGDTIFSRIIALVEDAEAVQAPVQKLADRVASWLIPVVLIFLIGVYLVTRDVSKVVTLMIFTSPAELGLATPLVNRVLLTWRPPLQVIATNRAARIARATRHRIDTTPAVSTLPPEASTERKSTESPRPAIATRVSVNDACCRIPTRASGKSPDDRAARRMPKPKMNHGTNWVTGSRACPCCP